MGPHHVLGHPLMRESVVFNLSFLLFKMGVKANFKSSLQGIRNHWKLKGPSFWEPELSPSCLPLSVWTEGWESVVVRGVSFDSSNE